MFKWGPQDVKSRRNKIELNLTPFIDITAQYELVFNQTGGKNKLKFKSSVLVLDGIEYSEYVEKLDDLNTFNISITGTPSGEDKNAIMFRTVLSGKGSSGNVIIRKAKGL